MPKDPSLSSRFLSIFNYTTVKLVRVHSWKLGLLHFAVQLGVLLYILVWVVLLKKGYQGTGSIVGNTSIKVKGGSYLVQPDGSLQVWDVYDAVQPPKEENALFITTAVAITPNQQRGVCLGNDATESCNRTRPCVAQRLTLNGVLSGGACNLTVGYCPVQAWCPLEKASPQISLLEGVQEMTVFVRSTVNFPRYNITLNNANGSAVTNGYNLFTVRQLLELANVTFDSVRVDGAAFGMIITWDCNLDYDSSKCTPNFAMRRLSGDSALSKGLNYRYINTFQTPGPNGTFVQSRNLVKVMGLRFVFILAGQAAKFDIVPLLVNIGSGVGLLALASIVSDFCALNILPERSKIRTAKFADVSRNSASVRPDSVPYTDAEMAAAAAASAAAIAASEFASNAAISDAALRARPVGPQAPSIQEMEPPSNWEPPRPGFDQV